MKPFFLAFALLAVVLAIWPFIFSGEQPRAVTNLPWQITLDERGDATVFSLRPGIDTLARAIAVLGGDMALAIVEGHGEVGQLEVYYSHYRAGLLTGKLILRADNSQSQIERWKAAAVAVDYMQSGQARKYRIDVQAYPEALDSTVFAMTFIPAVRLDEDVIVSRFGKAGETITVGDAGTHYLYPSLGLDVTLAPSGRAVLQYVRPSQFGRLRDPLLAASGGVSPADSRDGESW